MLKGAQSVVRIGLVGALLAFVFLLGLPWADHAYFMRSQLFAPGHWLITTGIILQVWPLQSVRSTRLLGLL